MAKVFVSKESHVPGETRVAATPETVKKMVAAGLEVAVEAGAGQGSHIADDAYEKVGARIASDRDAELEAADVVLGILAPPSADVERLKPAAIVVGLMAPHQNLGLVRAMADGKVSSLAMELVPRITRAQDMDVLSSQASIAGYKAVLMAAYRLGGAPFRRRKSGVSPRAPRPAPGLPGRECAPRRP